MEITLYIRYSFHGVKTCDLQMNALLAQVMFVRDVLLLKIRHRRLLLSVVENVSFEIVFLEIWHTDDASQRCARYSTTLISKFLYCVF